MCTFVNYVVYTIMSCLSVFFTVNYMAERPFPIVESRVSLWLSAEQKKDGPSSRLVILRAAGSGYFPVTDPQKRHWFVLSFLLYHYLIGSLFRSLRFWSHRKLESRRNANSHLNSASFLLIWRSTRVFIDRIIWLFISREYLQRPKLASQHFLLWSLQTLTFISPSLYSLA